VTIERYARWARNHVQPYLPDLTSTTLTSPGGARSVLVADVPAGPMATPPRLRHRRPAGTKISRPPSPYRDRDHIAWTAEHQLERDYRDRFTRAQHTDDALHHLPWK
jgi:hypothetical protein